MRACAALAIAALAACGRAPTVDSGAVSASLALVPGGMLAVTDPDQGTVSFIDPDSLALTGQVAVGGEPHDLVVAADGALWVSTSRGGEVVVVDPASATVTARVTACAGPRGLAIAPDHSYVAVACEWSGTVIRIDAVTRAVSELASGLLRPRALAIVGTALLVTEYTGGDLVAIAADGTTTAVSLVPSSAPYRPALSAMTANLPAAVIPVGDTLYVAHELVNHDGDTTSEMVDDDYGSVTDGNPKINPAVSALELGNGAPIATTEPVLYARFDGSPRAATGAVALAAFDARYVLVANVSSNSVTVLDTRATTPDARQIASFAVGAGPAGIAIDAATGRAFVDNAFDGSISRLDLTRFTPAFDGASAPRLTAELTLVRAQASVYSAAALAGRRTFYDATNPHVTPSGVVACATCHPAGGEDGLVWFIHTPTIPLKRRRTLDLANAHDGTAPYHWDGEFPTLDTVTLATVTDLMAGDGLLVNADEVAAYVNEIVQPPTPPAGDAASIARGQAIFMSASAACATCHIPPLGTDGKLYALLAPMALSSDDGITMSNTPGLAGVFLHSPYFHDGRSPDLHDLLTRSDAAMHGGIAGLAAGDLDDLVAYLRSL